MRFLFTFVGGVGHLEPLLPFACALRAAGHAVAFACAPAMSAAVQEAGFSVLAVGAASGGPPERLPLRPVDREREARDLRERFVRGAGRERAPRILELCGAWRPDALVRDETDFGAAVAAEKGGLPFATVLVTAAGSFLRPELVAAALDALRAEHGLAPDPRLAMPGRYLVLSSFPPSFRDPGHPLPATAHAFRPPLADAPRGDAPAWASVLAGAPALYATLGTVFNTESGDLLGRVVEGLRDLPANVLVTVGPQLHPAELGAQPAHVRVKRFVPQASVLPYCDAVVSHGGSGTLLGALAHGLPSLLLPLGADQPWNADRCADLGAAWVLDAMEATPARIRGSAAGLLASAECRRSAERLRDEIAALPDPSAAVPLLERLAKERAPIVSAPGG